MHTQESPWRQRRTCHYMGLLWPGGWTIRADYSSLINPQEMIYYEITNTHDPQSLLFALYPWELLLSQLLTWLWPLWTLQSWGEMEKNPLCTAPVVEWGNIPQVFINNRIVFVTKMHCPLTFALLKGKIPVTPINCCWCSRGLLFKNSGWRILFIPYSCIHGLKLSSLKEQGIYQVKDVWASLFWFSGIYPWHFAIFERKIYKRMY